MSIGLVQVSRTNSYAPALETAIVMTINGFTYNMLVDVNEKETYVFKEDYTDICNSTSCQVNKTVGTDVSSRQIPFQRTTVSANITIGNITFEEFPLLVFTEVLTANLSGSEFNTSLYSGLDGVIGLDSGSTFIEASGQKCGTSGSYGLYLGRQQDTDINSTTPPYVPGTLIIGGYDTFKTNLTSDQLPTNNLNITLYPLYNNSISERQSATSPELPMTATIDSLSTWNWLPNNIYDAWHLNPADMPGTVDVNVTFDGLSMQPIKLDGRMFRKFDDPDMDHIILGQPFLANVYITRANSQTSWNVVNSTSTTEVHQQIFGSPQASGSPTPASSSSPNNSGLPGSSGNSNKSHSSVTGALVGGILGGILGLILILMACICLLRRRRRNKNRQSRESMQPMRTRGSGIFTDSNMAYPPILPPPPTQPSLDNTYNINTNTANMNTNNHNNINNNPFMYEQANHNASTTSEIAAKTMEMSPIVHTRQDREMSSNHGHGGMSAGAVGGGEESDEEGDVNDIDADRRSLVSEPYHEGITPVQPRNSMGMTSANAPRLPFSRVSATGLHDGGGGL